MFGYVRPLRAELKVREWESYQAVYCGLCTAMGRKYGFLSRFFLSYDFTLLAMLLLPPAEGPGRTRCRCPARLWCGKKPCTAPHPGMDRAAGESVILAWWKLQDTLADGNWWERFLARGLSLALGRAYRRARADCPDFDKTVKECLTELHDLERDRTPSIDRPADAFARLLAGAGPVTGRDGPDRAMYQLLYHLGRWIYLVDAWDDLAEDREKGRYNPIALRFSGAEEESREALALTLRHSRALAGSASQLVELGQWRGIVDNILYLGLPAVERLVLEGRWGSRKGRRDPLSS
ncbi:hypothetical protein H7U37_08620 [Pseudoflavonifractor phocaeensis]|uniref:DUF5685 family protein n=1 Tax=Pseudoflavonifractor phocaeensis TaxID=1870988 RepID=UPI00195E24AD|nr:hypothetical protein [Pseudoflavonifractor phocaeensis]MBM6938584.1 hypothetical protein [Pseudoflavonifractor phocaeensis]